MSLRNSREFACAQLFTYQPPLPDTLCALRWARCVFIYDDPNAECSVCEAVWSVVESRCSIAQRAAGDSTSCRRVAADSSAETGGHADGHAVLALTQAA